MLLILKSIRELCDINIHLIIRKESKLLPRLLIDNLVTRVKRGL